MTMVKDFDAEDNELKQHCVAFRKTKRECILQCLFYL